MAPNESAVHPDGAQLNPQLEEQIKTLIRSQLEEQIQIYQESNPSMVRVDRKEMKEKNLWTEIFVPAIPTLTAIIVAVWFIGSELSRISTDLEALKDRTDRMELRIDKRFDQMDKRFDQMDDRFNRLEDILLNPQKGQTE